jgi:LytS/YehU family sensor histidine kinase
MFKFNLAISQVVGFLIHIGFAAGKRLVPDIVTRGMAARFVYFAGIPLAAVFIAFWLAVSFIGGGSASNYVLSARGIGTIGGVSLLISGMLLAVYIPRERAARAEAAMAQQKAAGAAAEREATLARMKLLEAQVEPHFLYNTLAHVDSLIETDSKAARRMLERLIVLLRAAALSATERATLASQIEWTRAYLDVLALRMGSRLSWTIDVPADLGDMPVPPALLQPVVENAIKHGLEPKVDGGRIAIAAVRDAGGLTLTVVDTGVGFRTTSRRAASTGIGLANLRARLATFYGADAALTIEDNAPNGARVTLRLPNP